MADNEGIPRFGSFRASEADYDPYLVRIAGRMDVLLDGEPAAHVIAYSCDEGWIRQRRSNARGRPFLENGKCAERILRGNVTVAWS